MLFFKKKPKEAKPLPVEDVQRMSARGMSDKDIIKSLKTQGYSYEEIEQAMLQAVKEGVARPEQTAVEKLQPPAQPQQQEQQAPLDFNSFNPPQEQPKPAEQNLPDILPEESIEPEAIVEELVEGVVEEKWQKFEARLKEYESQLADLKQRVEETGASGAGHVPSDDGKFEELAGKLEDIEARVGGLEKAFKQFLPSLTRNIESLSRIIHEMKARQVRA